MTGTKFVEVSSLLFGLSTDLKAWTFQRLEIKVSTEQQKKLRFNTALENVYFYLWYLRIYLATSTFLIRLIEHRCQSVFTKLTKDFKRYQICPAEHFTGSIFPCCIPTFTNSFIVSDELMSLQTRNKGFHCATKFNF